MIVYILLPTECLISYLLHTDVVKDVPSSALVLAFV